MHHFIDQILAFISAHPGWAAVIIGLTAFGESFAFLSLIFPGTALLVAAGALAAVGTIEPVSAILAGIIGATLGDSVSFWIGQRFGPLLPSLWPFRGHPEMLKRGTDFFERHGSMSVFIGRFFGPVRAVIPLAAGMMHMPVWRFTVANVLSAAIWAPALVLSGMFLSRELGGGDIEDKIFIGAVVLGVAIPLFLWVRSRLAKRGSAASWPLVVSFANPFASVWPRDVVLTREQTHAVVASYLGWTLDAFDFFLFVFVMKDVASEFGTDVTTVSWAILLTLAFRPLGAFIFGRAADRWGRRPTLMVDIILFASLEAAAGFAPSLAIFFVLRALFGIAMGGEWGVGSSLAMETIPPKARGFVSGLLQSGYPTGYLLASIVYALFFPLLGWRGMFFVGVLPALLVLYIRRSVSESPHWQARAAGASHSIVRVLKEHWRLALYAVALMTAFNFLSHGTQDLYPTFLRVQHGFSSQTVGAIAIIYNIGAILGGIACGALSERLGRRRIMVTASLLTLLVLPLFAFGTGPVMLAVGAFLMQVAVQGAWGVVPAHLNELSPDQARGTFPGVVYQLGNFFASSNAVIQTSLAEHFDKNYGVAFALVVALAAIAIAVLAPLGREARGEPLGTPR